MIELDTNQYYKILLVLSLLIEFSTTYKMMAADDHRLCSPITKRKIKLGLESSSAIVVSLGRLQDHSWAWEKNFVCKFQIDTTKKNNEIFAVNNGIFAVIQQIVFRKNESTDECLDYVQYKRHDGSTSKRYCGRLNAALGMDQIFAPDVYATNLAPTINSFVDPSGRLDVNIYIAREALRSDEEMELEIVFTSFSYCSGTTKGDLPCSDKHTEHCIYKDFFNDGYVNCPYPDCVDESGCSEKMHDERKKSVGNKVIIGSVTLLLIVFIFFICFLWLCRKYKKLCWAEEFANPTSTNPHNSRTFEMNEPSARDTAMPSSGRVVSAAPVAGSTEEDKDLPPSYDSLFPDR